MQRTLVVIKPDAILKGDGVVEAIKQRYLGAGLIIVKEFRYCMSRAAAAEFYRDHVGKPYFEGLVLAMGSGMIEVLLIEGEDAINVVRKINGPWDAKTAEPGTVRKDFPSAGGPFNMVHASDSEESAKREIALMFP